MNKNHEFVIFMQALETLRCFLLHNMTIAKRNTFCFQAHRCCLLLFVALVVFSLRGSSQDLNSFRKIISEKNPHDTSYVLALTEIAYRLIAAKPDSSLYYANQANRISKEINYLKGMGRATRVLGIYYGMNGDFDKALQSCQEALQFSQDAEDLIGLANCYGNIGIIYRNQGNYAKSLDFQFKCLKVKEEMKDSLGLGLSYNNIGNLFYDQRDYEKALEYFQKSIDVLKSINAKSGITTALNNMTLVFIEIESFEKAMHYQTESIQIQIDMNDQFGLTHSYNQLALINIRLRQFDNVMPFIEKGLMIARRIKSEARYADLLTVKATYFNSTGNFQKAYVYADSALAIARKIGSLVQVQFSIEQKYVASSQLGLYKEALNNYEQFIHLRDSLANQENVRLILSKEFQGKEEKLKIGQEKNEIQLASERRVKTIFISGFSIVLILAIVIFIGYRIRTKLNTKLSLQNEEIKSQNELIEQINKELQARALRAQMNPHFIFNSLTAIQSLLIENKNRQCSEYLMKFAKLLRQVMMNSELNWISLKDELEILKLYLELESLRFRDSFHYQIRSEFDEASSVKIPPMIIQPYVENAIHHGLLLKKEGERNLNVLFKEDPNGITCEISDNGVGRAYAKKYTDNRKLYQSRGTVYTEERIKVLNTTLGAKSSVEIIDLEERGNAVGTKVKIFFSYPSVKKSMVTAE
jgi:tetratricopeptide (TPR) repeat protein